jgi:hypothetical protein
MLVGFAEIESKYFQKNIVGKCRDGHQLVDLACQPNSMIIDMIIDQRSTLTSTIFFLMACLLTSSTLSRVLDCLHSALDELDVRMNHDP